jgi:hypothetical protein
MKKLFGTLAVLALLTFVFASCSGKKDSTDETKVLSASTEEDYKQFQEFQDWKKNQEMAKSVVYTAPAATKTIVKKSTPVYRNSAPVTKTTVPATVPSKKKGWSKAAKGAVIGAAGGAAAGAIINKRNRAVGAAIGGVLGAGVGFGIGRTMDKKDGRY